MSDIVSRQCFFKEIMIQWYKKKGRDFPWRGSKDPYQILIAEIFLQRTRAEQVLPIFLRFIKEFPDFKAICMASENKIGKYFEKLGLKKRGKYVKELSKIIYEDFGGRVPNKRQTLMRLPGIGLYTAHAVLVFGYGQNFPVVDSNVIRVINRYFALGYNKHKPNKNMLKKAEELTPEKEIRSYSFGILDFSADVCLPRKPKCEICPLESRCYF